MKRRLIVSDGQRERELLLVGTIVVGRDPACDVSEDGDSLLSRRHTEFVASADGVVVRDLGSRNGTFVNGVKIAESAIRPGDLVHIGHLRLRYVEGDAPSVSPPEAAPVHSAEDEEVTRIVQAVRPPPPPRAESAPRPPAPSGDDDRTVVTPRPGPSPARAVAPPPVDADEECTVFVTSSASGRTPVPAVSEPRIDAHAAARASARESLPTFVSIQIAVVAAIVFLTVALAFALGRSELLGESVGAAALLKWLGPAAALAAAVAYGVGRSINRRIAGILTADKEEGRGV